MFAYVQPDVLGTCKYSIMELTGEHRTGLAREAHNTLMAALPRGDYEALMTGGEVVDLKLKDVLHEADDEARHVYFPLSGVISLLTVLEDGSAVEIATVGSEGMADFAAYLGMESPARWLVQVPGKALRIDAKRVRLLAEDSPPF